MIALLLCLMFPHDSVWNHQVSGLPIAAQSRYWSVNFFRATTGIQIAPPESCAVPILHTGPAWQRMTFDWPATSDTCLYPFTYVPGNCGPDHGWAAVDTVNDLLYGIFSAHDSSHAAAGARWDLKSDALRPEGWNSESESGMPAEAGWLEYDEVESGTIFHALSCSLPWFVIANGHVWPARSPEGSLAGIRPNPIPMGTRWRLRADFPVAADASPEYRAIIKCLEDYGAFVVDRNGIVGDYQNVGETCLEMAADPRWPASLRQEIAARTVGFSWYMEFVDESKFMAEPNSMRWKSKPWWWPF